MQSTWSRDSWRAMVGVCGAAVVMSACRAGSSGRASSGGELTPALVAKADKGIPPYTAADVRFMQGMIGHHAQAVVMAAWAPASAATNEVRVLAARIAVGQNDEIAFMQRWLRDRGQTVPEVSAPHDHAGMNMGGMDMTKGSPMMPGMLTPAQMTQLQHAKGAEFDKLFLTFMIQHHQGALVMVDELFSARGAGQDDSIFKFASDVTADQSTEIARMESILKARAATPNQNP